MNTDPALTAWPWAQPAWERTLASLGALHHGLLITGPPGIAKREFALALSQTLLCADPASGRGACGRCRNCKLFNAATHPDFHVLTTEREWRDGRLRLTAEYCNRYQDISAREKRANPGQVISVDQVRLLIERFHAHAHTALRKIALLMPADRMNINAANALLKLLEEPPAHSVLILVSAVPGYLPATIRSRCFQIKIPPPDLDTARAWLCGQMPEAPPEARAEAEKALSSSGPADVLQMHADGFLLHQARLLRDTARLANGQADALELAAQWIRHDFLRVLDFLHRLSGDLIKYACGVGGQAPLELRSRPLSTGKMFALYEQIGWYRKIAREPLNEQLAMEELLLALRDALAARH
ncbi:MAG: hypothetical protein OXU22_08605 [Gammaproteobacteria bacterium]|nr:hypothetical protein [Gammaproteobacteria bacterium]